MTIAPIKRSADAKARDYTEEAIDVMAEIMRDPLAEHRDRLRAAETLVERGYGKAAQAIIAVPLSRQAAQLAATMSDEELLERIRATPLPRLMAPIPDADFQEVEEGIDPLLR